MLLVKLTHPDIKFKCWWLYGIYESESGKLLWGYVSVERTEATRDNHNAGDTTPPHLTCGEYLENCGYLAGGPVSEHESELLTGLHYPASMDRLRELVHSV